MKKLYTIFAFLCIHSIVYGNTFNFHYKLSDSTNINFKLLDYTPKEKYLKKYPLLVFLHGKGECGIDNEKQMYHLKKWLPDSLKKSSYNCYFLAPQIPVNQTWSYYNKHEEVLNFADSCPLSQQILIRVIDSLSNQLNIDINRIYIIGISMGAFGVTDIVCRNPLKFAAAIAICGGGASAAVNKKLKTSFWLFHGKKDTTVPHRHSVNYYEKISAIKPNTHRLTLYENVNHTAWVNAFKEKDILSWLFSKKTE